MYPLSENASLNLTFLNYRFFLSKGTSNEIQVLHSSNKTKQIQMNRGSLSLLRYTPVSYEAHLGISSNDSFQVSHRRENWPLCGRAKCRLGTLCRVTTDSHVRDKVQNTKFYLRNESAKLQYKLTDSNEQCVGRNFHLNHF